MPDAAPERDAYGRVVGADGYALLDALDGPGAPADLARLPEVGTLRAVWARHFERPDRPPGRGGEPPAEAPAGTPALDASVRLRDSRTLPRAAEGLESPYDVDARFRTKRATAWTGYMVHVSETCDQGDAPHLITHVDTTPATAHEATGTDAIHAALAAKALAPAQHLVDAAYVSAALLVRSREAHGVDLVGPPRPDVSAQTAGGGYGVDAFRLDWARRQAVCPEGVASAIWGEYEDRWRGAYVRVRFPGAACRACPARAACCRPARGGRSLTVHREAEHAALAAARARQDTDEGRQLHNVRAGVEGTLSQAVRAFGLRRARYRGLPKTRVQHAATAAALNLERLAAWLDGRPRAATRTSRFARLAA